MSINNPLEFTSPLEVTIGKFNPLKNIDRLHATPLSAKYNHFAEDIFGSCDRGSTYRVLSGAAGLGVGLITTCIAAAETIAALAYAILVTSLQTLTLGRISPLQDHVVKVWAYTRHSFLMIWTPITLFANIKRNNHYEIELRAAFRKINCAQAAHSIGRLFDIFACRNKDIKGVSPSTIRSIETAIEGLTKLINENKAFMKKQIDKEGKLIDPSTLQLFNQAEFVNFLMNYEDVKDDAEYNEYFENFHLNGSHGKDVVESLASAMVLFYRQIEAKKNPHVVVKEDPKKIQLDGIFGEIPANLKPYFEPKKDKPVIAKPVVNKPVIGEPVIGEPVIGEPVIAEPKKQENPPVNKPILMKPIDMDKFQKWEQKEAKERRDALAQLAAFNDALRKQPERINMALPHLKNNKDVVDAAINQKNPLPLPNPLLAIPLDPRPAPNNVANVNAPVNPAIPANPVNQGKAEVLPNLPKKEEPQNTVTPIEDLKEFNTDDEDEDIEFYYAIPKEAEFAAFQKKMDTKDDKKFVDFVNFVLADRDAKEDYYVYKVNHRGLLDFKRNDAANYKTYLKVYVQSLKEKRFYTHLSKYVEEAISQILNNPEYTAIVAKVNAIEKDVFKEKKDDESNIKLTKAELAQIEARLKLMNAIDKNDAIEIDKVKDDISALLLVRPINSLAILLELINISTGAVNANKCPKLISMESQNMIAPVGRPLLRQDVMNAALVIYKELKDDKKNINFLVKLILSDSDKIEENNISKESKDKIRHLKRIIGDLASPLQYSQIINGVMEDCD